ncbi:MAG: hypothetical protein KDA87_04350 [Planctomycetales bacterium]|nr:hypothetical protein [Planctomycetales bacterium]
MPYSLRSALLLVVILLAASITVSHGFEVSPEDAAKYAEAKAARLQDEPLPTGDAVLQKHQQAVGTTDAILTAAEDMQWGLDFESVLPTSPSLDSIRNAHCLGRQAIGGQVCFHVRIEARDGSVEDRWFDVRSFLLVQVEQQRTTSAGTFRIARRIAQYHEVNGVQMPFRIETEVKRIAG